MKMVKSLILGTAAAFAATAAAQAADLPVKAKPVGYVKICPQYGPGFYYIPGTDICIKVGGLATMEFGIRNGNQTTEAPISSNGNGANLVINREDNDYMARSRIYLILDTRQATPYGVLRTYVRQPFGVSTSPNGNVNGTGLATATAGAELAFLQFAGFTVGQTDSFFTFGNNYNGIGMASVHWTWTQVVAYTANFGGGLSATISLEDPSSTRYGIVNAAYITASPGGAPAPSTIGIGDVSAGFRMPNVVGNVRIDQAWGSAQIMGAVTELEVNGNTFAGGLLPAGVYPNSNGYAIGAGIVVNLPFIAPGDTISIQGVYSEGAVEYTGLGGNPLRNGPGFGFRQQTGAVGGPAFTAADAVTTATGIERTEAWSINGQFRHFFSPALRVAVFAGYTEVNFGTSATAQGYPSAEITQIGGNIAWSPVKDLNIQLDVLWTDMSTSATALQAAGSDDILAFRVNVNRPF